MQHQQQQQQQQYQAYRNLNNNLDELVHNQGYMSERTAAKSPRRVQPASQPYENTYELYPTSSSSMLHNNNSHNNNNKLNSARDM